VGVAQLEEALSDSTFTPETYRLDIPTLDGHAARNLSLRFSGNAKLDGTRNDDVALLQAARLGKEVRLIVTGQVQTKSFSLDTKGEELAYSFVVRVESVEAGELV
jgi:hypothetical protein